MHNKIGFKNEFIVMPMVLIKLLNTNVESGCKLSQ